MESIRLGTDRHGSARIDSDLAQIRMDWDGLVWIGMDRQGFHMERMTIPCRRERVPDFRSGRVTAWATSISKIHQKIVEFNSERRRVAGSQNPR